MIEGIILWESQTFVGPALEVFAMTDGSFWGRGEPRREGWEGTIFE